MQRVSFLISCLLLVLTSAAEAQIDARLLRYPDVSQSQIAFVYAGDIWLVDKEGGTASRLSTPAGEEAFPRFSPDGSMIAFTGNYDGGSDVYVMPTSGGIPQRLTHHPAQDRCLGWYPDGRSILFASFMTSERNRYRKLFRVPITGGLPEQLPLPYGEVASLADDGKTLAYVPITREFRTWKRYRGGMAPDIWLFDLESHQSQRVTTDHANDSIPMWHGSTLYFLSDRDEHMRANIWAWDRETGTTRQLTTFTDFDVRFPAIGPDEIVFENGGSLYLLDLATEKTRLVEVEVITDRSTLRPRAEKVARLIVSGDISPSGKRVVLEARGELFSIPAEHGVILNLTQSSGVAERYPAFSPDGTWIAYLSDRSGEYELTVRRADGQGEEQTISSLGPGFRYHLSWSPDSTKIAFIDSDSNINVFDRATRSVRVIDQDPWRTHGDLGDFRVSWSPDSRWLTYSRGVANQLETIFLYDTTSAELHQVTRGFYDSYEPTFDREGKYLLYLCLNDPQSVYADLDPTWVYAGSAHVMAMPLRKDVPSPLAPRNDEEPGPDETKGEAQDKAKDKNKDKDKDKAKDKAKVKGESKDEKKADDAAPAPVEIDLDGLAARAVQLPPAVGTLDSLSTAAGKVLYRRNPLPGTNGGTRPLMYYDLKEREEKTILGNVDAYVVSADGSKLLVAVDHSFGIIDVAADQTIKTPLRVGELEMTVDPPAEWRQLFREAWRLERDYFYDPNLHGVDWKLMGERYGALLDDAVTRWDVNFLIGELIAELNSSHAYRGGGDLPDEPERGVGMLGVDWELADGAYRIAHIVRAAPWDTEVRSPLTQPGVDIAEGDWVLAVNGRPIDTSTDPWAAFQGLADTTVQLTVNDRPSLEGARQVLVRTLADEYELRYLAWVEANRHKVEEASDGQIGYVYVPSTGRDGQRELYRMLRAQINKPGMIIDERFNSGGQIPDRFVELLNRPVLNYWAVRNGQDRTTPPVAHHGPKVMLINGWSGSGGDAFPAYFRKAGLGPLIGTRTWGGLIGISGAPPLIDGGRVTVPTFAYYEPDGTWAIEGIGVEPDIEVVDDPALMVNGGDPQLERAIVEVKAALEAHPVTAPVHPECPIR